MQRIWNCSINVIGIEKEGNVINATGFTALEMLNEELNL